MNTAASVRRPGEFIHQPFMRSIFASVADCLEAMGEPLTPAQVAILEAAVASSGTDVAA